MKNKTDEWLGEFDFSNPETVKKEFKKNFETIRKNQIDFFGKRQSQDFDRVRYSRRMETALKNVQYAREMVGDAYPDYPGVTYFEMDWAFVNASPLFSYDEIDRRNDLLLAAAIWILDTLREDHYLYQVEMNLLPELTEDEAQEIPAYLNADDSEYSLSLLTKTVYVLAHRNDDCNVYTSKNEKKRTILDEATARNKNRQDVPSRMRFEKLISELKKERIEEAVQEFKDKYWFIARCYFAGLKKNHEERDKLIRSHDRLIRKLNGYSDNNKIHIKIKPGEKPEESERINSIVELNHALSRCAEALELGVTEKEDYTGCFSEAAAMNPEERREVMSEEFDERFRSFRIENPYRLAFALLYLADRGDDLIWMYYFGTALAQMTADTLPWRYSAADDDLFMEEDEQNEEKTDVVLPDFYEMKYGNDDLDHYEERTNLAQQIFRLSGVIVPRNYDLSEWDTEYWNEIGVSEEEQKLIGVGAGFLKAMNFRRTDEFKDPSDTADAAQETAADHPDSQSKIQELEHRILTLRKENKMLKEASWTAQNQNAKLSEKLEKAYRDAQSDKDELAKLREAIFLLQNPESEIPDETVPLPFEVKRRVVICGGHDSFIKQFNQLITGNVRYLNNVKINEELIRNADEIWIQTNAISHSDYYKIVNLCRKSKQPLNYFRYASARKCAEQVVKQYTENEQ